MAVMAMEGFERDYWTAMNPDLALTRTGAITTARVASSDYGSKLSIQFPAAGGSAQNAVIEIGNSKSISDWGNYFVFGFRFTLALQVASGPVTIGRIYNDDGSGTSTGDIIKVSVEYQSASVGVLKINGAVPSSAMVLENNVEYYLEIEVDKVALKARAWLTNQLIGDAPLTGSEAAIGYRFGWRRTDTTAATIYNNVMYVDDHYSLNGTGTFNTTRLGRVKVIERLPQADATVEFVRDSGTSNASVVADVGDPATDSTFVHSNEAGAVDLYTNSDALPFDAPVLAIAVSVAARKGGADARAVAPMVESGSADAVGDRINLLVNSVSAGTSVFDFDPATNDAWTQAAAATTKFGQTLVV